MKSRGRLSIRINLRNFYRRKGEASIQPACHLKRRKIHWGNQLFPCIFVPRPTGIVITGDKSLRGHRLGQGINETDMIRWPWRVSLISDVPLGRVHGGTFESTMCLAPRHVIRPHKDWNRVMPGNSLPRSPTLVPERHCELFLPVVTLIELQVLPRFLEFMRFCSLKPRV